MSIKINVHNQKAEPVGEIELADKIFNVKVNEALVHQAAITQKANERQVLGHTLTKGEVRGGGRKPWRQKGTGRARAGSSRSPIWIGGGITFGPRKERNFKKNINRKMKQKAIFMALPDRVKNNNFAVIDKIEIPEYKTKLFNAILKEIEEKIFLIKDKKSLSANSGRAKKPESKVANDKKKNKEKVSKLKRSILVINDANDEKYKYSGRNLAGVKLLHLDNLNILDLLKYKNLIITKSGIEKLEKRYS